jgi:hypothetical protein
MRILTWNLDHSKPSVRDEQFALIAEQHADIEVLTEPGPAVAFDAGGLKTVASPPERSNDESWVVIRGENVKEVEFEIPYQRMAAAATTSIDGRDLLIYGSVLPWNSAAHQDHDVFDLPDKGVPSAAIYGAWLTDQLRDIWKLSTLEQYKNHKVLWVGDLNVPVSGELKYHNPAASEMLKKALSKLSKKPYNANKAHALPNVETIDLICGPKSFKVTENKRIDGIHGNKALSDDCLYRVDLEIQ